MAVLAYHPETQAQVVMDEGALLHMRMSGWMTQAEYDANQAAAAEAAEKAKDSGNAAKKEK